MGFDNSFLTERAHKIEVSGIRKFFDLIQSMPDAINLSIGMVHYDVPDELKEVAYNAIRTGKNKYSTTQGLPSVRAKVREYLKKRYDIGSDDDEVLITCGVAGGLLLATMNLVEHGDEVLVPDPYFKIYIHQTEICGGKAVLYNTYPDFRLRIDELEKKRTDKTKVLVINSPQNPTGTVYTEQELKDAAEWARKHNIFVISDEIYDQFVYDVKHYSIKKFYPEGTLVVGGMSKTWGMPGWRGGYALAPRWLFEKMMIMQQWTFVCMPTPFQSVLEAALDFDMQDRIAHYHKKRDYVYSTLKEYFECKKPDGAFYLFPKLPEKFKGDADAFVSKAVEKGVLVVPGSAFSSQNTHFRVSYAASDEDLEKALKILIDIAK